MHPVPFRSGHDADQPDPVPDDPLVSPFHGQDRRVGHLDRQFAGRELQVFADDDALLELHDGEG